MNDDAFREVAEIRDELSRQGGLLRTLVYAQSADLIAHVLSAFEKDELLAVIFLALRTPQSQAEIVTKLRGAAGASQSSISRRMDKLEKELGLISAVGSGAAGIRFAHSESAHALRLIARFKRHPKLRALL